METCTDVANPNFNGAVYSAIFNRIQVCNGLFSPPDILRHEALHALDWAGGYPASLTLLLFKSTPGYLVVRMENLYPGWLRPVEYWAVLPLVVDWDFSALPDWIEAHYEPWFVSAGSGFENESAGPTGLPGLLPKEEIHP